MAANRNRNRERFTNNLVPMFLLRHCLIKVLPYSEYYVLSTFNRNVLHAGSRPICSLNGMKAVAGHPNIALFCLSCMRYWRGTLHRHHIPSHMLNVRLFTLTRIFAFREKSKQLGQAIDGSTFQHVPSTKMEE